jgi:hypothetical protein
MSIDLVSATGLGAIGPRIVGNLLGAANPYQHYRPLAGVAALDTSCLLGPLPAWLTVDAKLMGNTTMQDGKPTWYGGFDPSLTQPGDYLVGPFGTFFIANQTLPMPISLRYCNIVLSHLQYGTQTVGPSSRGGDELPTFMVANSFPAWLKSSERRSTPELQNPGEVPLPSANILLPVSMPAQIIRNDLLTGDDGSSWTVQSADLAASGWSIVAVKAAA